jgi:hypothetical protein
MLTYKFQIGQTVFIVPSLFRGSPAGTYIVTKKLPDRDGELEYCVKSAGEPYDRVVGESELRDVPQVPVSEAAILKSWRRNWD